MRPVLSGLVLAARAATYAVAATFVFLLWLGFDRHGSMQRPTVTAGAPLPALIDGTADRPFVQRVLVPGIVRAVASAVPRPTQRRIERRILQDGWPVASRLLEELAWDERALFLHLVGGAVVYGCLVALPFVVRDLHETVSATGSLLASASGLVTLLSVPLSFAQGAHFFYDGASLVLWPLALRLMLRRSWPYYVTYLAAVLNKETAILLAVVFALHWRSARAKWLAATAFQVFVWIAVRGAIAWVYRGNAGPLFMRTFGGNVSQMASRWSWPHFVLFVAMLCAGIAAWTAHPLLRAAFAVVGPFVIAYVLVGSYGEIRFFYEIWGLAVVVLVAGIGALRLDGHAVLNADSGRV